MAVALTKPAAFTQLHKGKHHSNLCTIFGTGILVGDTVTVTGTTGTTKTLWVGTIMVDNGDHSFDSSDLHVRREQVGVKPVTTGGTEDVTVTVTNQDNSSDSSAMPTPNVPVVH